jgi:crotonobetainyl-CoA:carnitine CoA-transferase CaiB-like acyl-CoA transferase
VAEIIRRRDAASWHEALTGLDCCATIVRSLEEAVHDDHFRLRGLTAHVAEQGGARLPMASLPLARSFRADGAVPRNVAAPGEHTEEILSAPGRLDLLPG